MCERIASAKEEKRKKKKWEVISRAGACRPRGSLYTYPSTSPLFFPRDAKSWWSSTPAKVPFRPATVPTKRTVPYMLPGTSTVSPMEMSSPAILPGVSGAILRGVSFSVLRAYISVASGMVASVLFVWAANEALRDRDGKARHDNEAKRTFRLGVEAVAMPPL